MLFDDIASKLAGAYWFFHVALALLLGRLDVLFLKFLGSVFDTVLVLFINLLLLELSFFQAID